MRAGSKVAGNIKNAVLPYVSRRAGQALARAQAQREVGSALNTADITPADAASRIRIRAAENVPASVSDLDDATRQLTGYSSRGMGPGQRAVRAPVQRRQSNMAQRMRQHVDESLGSTVNPHPQAAKPTEQTRPPAAPLDREPNQHHITLHPNLAEFADIPVCPE